MNYKEWEETVPASSRDDALWRVSAYRMALFLGDVAWRDATRLSKDHRTAELSGQLYRAVGSVSANLAEGSSKPQGPLPSRALRTGLIHRTKAHKLRLTA